jgi:hypothetical protein
MSSVFSLGSSPYWLQAPVSVFASRRMLTPMTTAKLAAEGEFDSAERHRPVFMTEKQGGGEALHPTGHSADIELVYNTSPCRFA